MATKIRPEVSKKNDYYISKHRYYELKHFCLQYNEWKRAYNDVCNSVQSGIVRLRDTNGNKVDTKLYVRQLYLDKINLVEETAKLTDPYFADYILKGVTQGLPYTYFKQMMSIPCCKDSYYEMYHKFFYLLSKKR